MRSADAGIDDVRVHAAAGCLNGKAPVERERPLVDAIQAPRDRGEGRRDNGVLHRGSACAAASAYCFVTNAAYCRIC